MQVSVLMALAVRVSAVAWVEIHVDMQYLFISFQFLIPTTERTRIF